MPDNMMFVRNYIELLANNLSKCAAKTIANVPVKEAQFTRLRMDLCKQHAADWCNPSVIPSNTIIQCMRFLHADKDVCSTLCGNLWLAMESVIFQVFAEQLNPKTDLSVQEKCGWVDLQNQQPERMLIYDLSGLMILRIKRMVNGRLKDNSTQGV